MNAFQLVRDLALMGGQVSERGTAKTLELAVRAAALGLSLAARQGSIDDTRLRSAAAMIAMIDRVSPEVARQAGNATAASIVVVGRVAISAVRLSLLTTARMASRRAASPGSNSTRVAR